MFHGISTVTYFAADLPRARRWYVDLLGLEPYFDTPAYIEFRVGSDQTELGILDSQYLGQLGIEPGGASSGPFAYWHVDDVHGSFAALVAAGAMVLHEPRDFGSGFVGAAVRDPFGNIVAIMHNPHYLARRSATEATRQT